MARLEDLKPGGTIKGILPDAQVTVIEAKFHGANVVELVYKDAKGRLGTELIYRYREPTLEIVAEGQPWSFDADAGMLRLVSEAYRIRLAYLFDPLLAIHTPLIGPPPHQIAAVCPEVRSRQWIPSNLHRCLTVCPGMLVEQWRVELDQRKSCSYRWEART
jgi:hypothetical protein